MFKVRLYLLLVIFYFAPANAQNTGDTCYSDMIKDSEEREEIFNATINVDASFKGGKAKWVRFLQNNLDTEKIMAGMPDSASFSDSIIIRFVVSKTGSLSNLDVIQANNITIREEIIRVIKRSCSMWNPPVAPSGRTINAWHQENIFFKITRMSDVVTTVVHIN